MAYGEIVAQDNDPSGVIHLMDMGIGKELMNLRGHLTQVSSLAFVPDGKTLISCGLMLIGDVPRMMGAREPQETKYIRFWDLARGKERPTQMAESRTRRFDAFSGRPDISRDLWRRVGKNHSPLGNGHRPPTRSSERRRPLSQCRGLFS